jgi:beta-aspartyl-peptidase (threonine type)
MSYRKPSALPRLGLAAAALLAASLATAAPPPSAAAPHPLVLVIHGGAGVIERSRMTPGREASFRAGLGAALDAGYAVLERGGTSLDAVIAAVSTMEDDPQFNAGRGAVLNHAGLAELDAAIMDGNGPRAGAVAAVHHVKNPIELARLVMDHSPHVMMVGEGAEEFALEQGVVLVPRRYFIVPQRVQELEEAKAKEAGKLKGPGTPGSKGTVGAVALDAAGNLAAATSTGGLTDKHVGRVGDSPIIGAGTYANNDSCAVSGTGDGEYYIRQVLAYDICAMVKYQHLPLEKAVHEAIHEKLEHAGGKGGVIALDRKGDFAMDFNSAGMFRGVRDSRGKREIAMYREAQ